MRLRIAFALALALVVTAGLFALLGALTSHAVSVEPRPPAAPIEFTPLIPDSPVFAIPREKPQLPRPAPIRNQPVPLPEPSPLPDPKGAALDFDPRRELAPGGDPFAPDGEGRRRGGQGLSDRSASPLVRIEPQYPPQAVQRGLEGWVTVQFTVAADGSVRDARVLRSSHAVFEREALRAVLRFKYRPQIEAGRAVELGQTLTLRFSLADGAAQR